MQDAANPALTIALLAGVGLSLATQFALFQRHIGGQPLLAYEVRRPVPWGPLATLLALFFVVLQLSTALFGGSEGGLADVEPDQFVQQMWINTSITIGIALLGMGWLHMVCGATRADLGFPASGKQAVTDIVAGAIACCAALLPVYLLLLVLNLIIQPEQGHPLIEQLLAERSPAMMLAGVATAVIAAPLFEEFTFRLLLQGALERWEDQQLGYQSLPLPEPTPISPEPEHSEPGFPQPGPEQQLANNPYASPITTSTPPSTTNQAPLDRPTHGLLPGLPHGWLPILASSFLFGLAHFGHGVDPIPLFLLGIALGYLYQRTHRLLPSIAAHMLFNAYSLTQLWLSFD